jgi:chromosome segregation ATPase
MPKKRLTDLLREEAEKSSESVVNDPVPPTDADESPETVEKSLESKAPDPSEASAERLTALETALQAEKNTVEKLQTQLNQAQQQKEDLEKGQGEWQANLQEAQKTIKKLEADLKKASQRYDKLEKSQVDLKNDLHDRKKEVKKLQADLQKSQQLQEQLNSELERVTNTARQFSEEKEKLQAELTALQVEHQALQHQSGRLVYPTNYGLIPKDKFLYNPLSNEDIGWFD